ncbi:hypothetical protein LPJ70_005263 [Coemansia sp. RSA 2708]|nr:hypothetical protein LPJ70_005263 [Coemansia sp. RSA 2708]
MTMLDFEFVYDGKSSYKKTIDALVELAEVLPWKRVARTPNRYFTVTHGLHVFQYLSDKTAEEIGKINMKDDDTWFMPSDDATAEWDAMSASQRNKAHMRAIKDVRKKLQGKIRAKTTNAGVVLYLAREIEHMLDNKTYFTMADARPPYIVRRSIRCNSCVVNANNR